MTFPKRSTDSFIGFLRGYWDYYRELENDFMTTRKYVSFNQDNFSTYSIEYLKLYQAVCSEIDVIGKDMANAANERFKPDDKQNNILKWWFEIQTKYRISESPSSSVEQYEAGIELPVFSCLFLGRFKLVPWDGFKTEWYRDRRGSRRCRPTDSTVPRWWTCYTSVKHNRMTRDGKTGELNYSKANLGNLVDAFAGLYSLEIAYMQSLGEKNDLETFADESRLFVEKRYVTSEDIGMLF